MLLSIISIFFITWLCYSWGAFILNVTKFYREFDADSFFWNTITGFCIILFIATVASLFLPLGSINVQLALLIPAIIFNRKQPEFFKHLKSALPNINILRVLLFCMLLLSLAMHSWTINHPDTLDYHQETIGWISRLKAITGLAYINHRFGYGGSWYIMCSLFSFHFAEFKALTFINIAVPVWFMLFFLKKADENWNKKNFVSTSIILAILLCFLVFSLLRLTLVSASPDFIASLFILLIFYYTLTGGKNLYFLSLLSATAIVIKLFALPIVMILALQSLLQIKKKPVRTLLAALLFITLISPFIARNIITTGYAIFPHPALLVTNNPHTLPAERVQHEKDYIKAYNRFPVNYSDQREVKRVATLPLNEWIPKWWTTKTITDKIFLTICFVSFITLLILTKRIIRERRPELLFCVITTFCGVLFWFYNAPEIRLGGGYLLAMPVLVILSFSGVNESFKKITFRVTQIATLMLILVITLYTAYRFVYYCDSESLISPKGSAVQIQYNEERLNKIPY